MPDVTLAPPLAAPAGPMPATHAIPNDSTLAGDAVARWQAHVDAGRIGIVPPGRSAEMEANYLQLDRILANRG